MARLETFPLQVGALCPHYPAANTVVYGRAAPSAKGKREAEELDSWTLPVVKFVFKGIVFLT